MERQAAGYREIEHTADWELEVWALDLPGLFEQAARGMYALAGLRLKQKPCVSRSLEISAEDAESLLVSFLSELLHFIEQEGLAFNRFIIKSDKVKLHAVLYGGLVENVDKEIKAVTFHNLQVNQTENGLQVNIVFDV
jgi:SHS2 domain-containing protein